jgi:hypothetical protein
MWWSFPAPVAADAKQRGLKHVLGAAFLVYAGTTSTLNKALSGVVALYETKAPDFQPEVG